MNDPTIYWIDEKDVIFRVSGPWDDFALENNGERACSEFVLGKPIWSFIFGETTKTWLNAIIGLVRIKQDIIERPYRCDSPSLKRYMSMRLYPESANAIMVEHELLFTESIRPPLYFVHSGIPSSNHAIRCAFCNKIRIENGWYEPEEAVERFNLETDVFLNFEDIVCRECKNSIIELMNK